MADDPLETEDDDRSDHTEAKDSVDHDAEQDHSVADESSGEPSSDEPSSVADSAETSAKKTKKKGKRSSADKKPKSKKASKDKSGGKKVTRRARRGRPAPQSSPVRTLFIYLAIFVGIGLFFYMLGGDQMGDSAVKPDPKWSVGDVVDVSITLVTTDVRDLACATDEEVGGLHCGFADKNKPHPSGHDAQTDDKVLQPYSTTDQMQFFAAGMWLQPELKAKLDKENWDNPSPRFTVNCKYKVAGKLGDALVRWKPEDGWQPQADWYAGSLSDCTIRKSGRAKPPPPPRRPKPAETAVE